jgi:hypothetical protein
MVVGVARHDCKFSQGILVQQDKDKKKKKKDFLKLVEITRGGIFYA